MHVFIYLCHVVVVLLQMTRKNIFTNVSWFRIEDNCRVVQQLVSCKGTHLMFCLQYALRDLLGLGAFRIFYFGYWRELVVFAQIVIVIIPRIDVCFYLFFYALLDSFYWTLFDRLLWSRLVLSFSFRCVLLILRFGYGDRACPLNGSGDYLPHRLVFFFALKKIV